MRYTLLLLLGLTLCLSAGAQRPSQYSLYMLNPYQLNPAYAGLDYQLTATGVFRRQWSGLDNAPSTQGINVHLPLYILNGGFGLKFENDQLGAEQSTTFGASYSYQLELGNGAVLSLGLGADYYQWSLDGEQLRTPDGNYEGGTIDHRDAVLPNALESGSTVTFLSGVYYQSEWLQAGLALRNITEPTVDLTTLSLQTRRDVNFIATAEFDMNSSIRLRPSVAVMSDLDQLQTNVGFLVEYNDNIFGGASFRGYDANTSDAVSIIGGFRLSEQVRLAYAYDLTLSELQQVSNGSHEIMLRYSLDKDIGRGRPPRIIYNPRDF